MKKYDFMIYIMYSENLYTFQMQYLKNTCVCRTCEKVLKLNKTSTIQQYKSSYKSESRIFLTVEKSYNKTVIDFNFGRHKDLSTLKSDFHPAFAASVNVTFWW